MMSAENAFVIIAVGAVALGLAAIAVRRGVALSSDPRDLDYLASMETQDSKSTGIASPVGGVQSTSSVDKRPA